MEEFAKLSPEARQQLLSEPLKKLTVDFAIYQMRTSHFRLLGNGDLKQKLVERVEAAYKRFRPMYLGEQPEPEKSVRHPKLWKVTEVVMDKKDLPLTKKMLIDAREERAAWLRRLDEIIATANVLSPQVQQEMATIWSYLNHLSY